MCGGGVGVKASCLLRRILVCFTGRALQRLSRCLGLRFHAKRVCSVSAMLASAASVQHTAPRHTLINKHR